MNNLIKSLLAKAHLEYHPDTNAIAERFAQLVVLECINTLQNNYAPDDHLPQEEIAGCLMHRFGIEAQG